MGKAVVVSFEDNIIRVVYASQRGGNITVQDTLLLNEDQFDNFLLQEKTDEFLVVNSFRDFFQEIILIPPVKSRYVNQLIEAEIRKKAPFSNFSFIHTVLGEKVVEGKVMTEIFVFSVRNDEINSIVERFVQRDKVVRAFYPDIFAMASLMDSEEKPVLCVIEAGLNKTLFLVNRGNVCFVRTVQSLESGLGDLDVQNINMTVNYCWQSLKMGPSIVMLTEHLCRNYNATMNAAAPVVCLTQRYVSGKSEAAHDYTAQVSALQIPSSSRINLLTKEFRRFFLVKRFLVYSSIFFLASSLAGAGYAAYSATRISGMKRELSTARKALPDIEGIAAAYDRKSDDLNRYSPHIAAMNGAALTPDIPGFLASLSDIATDNVRFVSISLAASEGALHTELKGRVKAERYGDAQRDYRLMVEQLGKMKGVVVSEQTFDLKNREFLIKADFNDVR